MDKLHYSAEEYDKLLTRLNDIGIALSAENDISKLTERIVDELRSLTKADAGTLYTLDKNKNSLKFEIVQTESLDIRMGGFSGVAITWLDVPLTVSEKPNNRNISAYVANTGKTVNIPDVYRAEGFNFEGTKIFDKKNNYRTQSTLTVPLIDHNKNSIGVLQLINARDNLGNVVPFANQYETLVRSLASQAAVAIENARLISDLKHLFKSLVVYSAKAIEARSPHTAGHSGRVSRVAKATLVAINRQMAGPFKDVFFSHDQIDEMSYAGWLHDIGKIGVPEAVLEKQNKLTNDQIDIINERFLLASFYRAFRDHEKNKKITWDMLYSSFNREWSLLSAELDYIREINIPGYLQDDKLKRLYNLGKQEYVDFQGERHCLLNEFEIRNLEVRKGNFTEEERKIMQSHVTESYRILKSIPFTEELAQIPNMVIEHHEQPNGTGYPHGLKSDEISLQGKVLCIADVFDALTAKDRPYKKSVPLAKTLEILKKDSRNGLLDRNIVDLFIKEKVYNVLPQIRKEESAGVSSS